MRISHLAYAVMLCIATPALAGDLPAGHPPLPATKVTIPSHSGTVSEVFPAPGYIYLHVAGPEGDEWIAGPAADIKTGAKIRWNDGAIMKNFASKTLGRTFETIRFVEVIEPADK